MGSVVKTEAYVRPKMHKVASSRGVGTKYREVGSVVFYTLGDVGLDIALFLNILSAPVDIVLAYATARNVKPQLAATQAHSTCQRHCLHVATLAAYKNLGCSNKPCAATLCTEQGHEQSRILIAGTCKERQCRYVLSGL